MIFETMRWLKQQDGKQDTDKSECDAKTVKRQRAERKTAETDGTTILSLRGTTLKEGRFNHPKPKEGGLTIGQHEGLNM